MSDTPRTDEQAEGVGEMMGIHGVSVSFARELERELAESKQSHRISLDAGRTLAEQLANAKHNGTVTMEELGEMREERDGAVKALSECQKSEAHTKAVLRTMERDLRGQLAIRSQYADSLARTLRGLMERARVLVESVAEVDGCDTSKMALGRAAELLSRSEGTAQIPSLNPHEDCCGQGCAVCQPPPVGEKP